MLILESSIHKERDLFCSEFYLIWVFITISTSTQMDHAINIFLKKIKTTQHCSSKETSDLPTLDFTNTSASLKTSLLFTEFFKHILYLFRNCLFAFSWNKSTLLQCQRSRSTVCDISKQYTWRKEVKNQNRICLFSFF